MASSWDSCLRLRLRLRLRPQPRPGPGQIEAKVEIMNEKLTTVGTIMSSESYNYIIHVLLLQHCSLPTGSDESSADVTMSMTMTMTMAMPQWQ